MPSPRPTRRSTVDPAAGCFLRLSLCLCLCVTAAGASHDAQGRPQPDEGSASRLLAIKDELKETAKPSPKEPAPPSPPVAVTGPADERLASFDRMMTSFLTEHRLPGASLAVARNGKLVYARGFGLADPNAGVPVEPDSLFRIASISKPITATAVLQLVERGRLGLDDKLVDLLDVQRRGAPVHPKDPRLKEVTVRHLLQHRGGWDRDKSFDPMFRSLMFARELGVAPPAPPWAIISGMWSRPLDFDPGERYHYSNYGYCLLGRIIERTTGLPYETYVRNEILKPIGLDSMRLGKTRAEERAPGEVHYVVGSKSRRKRGPSVIGPRYGEPVASPYGAWSLEAMDSHGGWLASAPDLVRFAAAFDPPRFGTLLNEASVKTLFARPDGRAGHDADGAPTKSYYACGWHVRDKQPGDGMNTWHTGALDGTSSLLVRRHDGLAWAVLFNSDGTADGKGAASLIDPLLHRAANAVAEWPNQEIITIQNKTLKQSTGFAEGNDPPSP